MSAAETTPPFMPRTADYCARVEESFARQRVMETLGISLVRVVPGEVELRFAQRDALTQ